MFKFQELKSIHLEISTRCQASCPMCPRKYHGGVENKNLKIADWTYEEFVTVITQSVLDQVQMIYFCGNLGDPIMNDDLIKMCRYIKSNAPHIHLHIHTNGGARHISWWQDLYSALPENHLVFFGIDGLEETNHLYRIGVKYDHVIRNARAFIDCGGFAEWVFIKFKHNEHEELEAERRSNEYGFQRFTVKNTTRFIEDTKYAVLDKDGNTEYFLEPPSDNQVVLIDTTKIKNFETTLNNSVIDCHVIHNKEIYIDAHKHVYPCCFTASAPYQYRAPVRPQDEIGGIVYDFRDKLLGQYHQMVNGLGGIDRLYAINNSIEDIIESTAWQTVWEKHWNEKTLLTCARVCGKIENGFSKPSEQFVKRLHNAKQAV